MFKKVLSLLIITCVLISAFSIEAIGASAPVVKNSGLENTGTTTDINAYNRIFYLPSNIDITKVQIETSAKTYSCKGGSSQAIPEDKTIDISKGITTDKYGNTCYVVTFDSSDTFTFYWGSAIGAVYVSTSNGIKMLRSDRNYKDKQSTIVITDYEGKVIYNDIVNATMSEIKGRGNASFSNEKKPFQIKLGKKTDLFGMGKAKTWILLANYNDSSYIRNTLAFKVANALELPYTPNSVFVELYIDNEYQGLYQLSEKTQIGTNRIEITDLEELNEKANEDIDLDSLGISRQNSSSSQDNKNLVSYTYATGMLNPDVITGGYLVELDNLYSHREKCIFETKNNNTYTVKSPEVASKEEMKYISNLFSAFEQALYAKDGKDQNGKYYTEYCDLDSLVKVYIVEEITKNWDAYVGSIFFYTDVDGMLHAGPVWDFDNTWGNIRGRKTFDTDLEEPWANADHGFGYGSTFGGALMQHEDAKLLASELYPIAASFFEAALNPGGYIEELTESLRASASMDMARWPVERRNQAFKYYTSYSDGTIDSCVGYLTNFITVRTEALYEYFNAEKNPHEHELEEIPCVEPTCDIDGCKEYWKCKICGRLFSDPDGEHPISNPQLIPKLGHDWGDWVVVREADYENEGLEQRVCKRDPNHFETRTIPKKEKQTTVTETIETTSVVTESNTSEQTTVSTSVDNTETVETTNADVTKTDQTSLVIWILVIVGIFVIFAVLVVTIIRKKKQK